jgi:hypothetical protein
MSSSVDLHLAYKVGNAEFNMFPYPHFFVPEVFPADFYRQLQAALPASSDMLPISQVRPVKGYDERFVLDLGGKQLESLPEAKRRFWQEVHKWLVRGRFAQVVLNKFGQFVNQRFSDGRVALYDEALLVQDTTHYKLGPHTDATRKVITLLFYLPRDESQRHLGTSIYVPKDPNFRCHGGPHYPHEGFDRVWTMPFVPNALFAFFKTDNSFHGVEPIADPDCKRWLLLYDIYAEAPSPEPNVAGGGTPAKFSF